MLGIMVSSSWFPLVIAFIFFLVLLFTFLNRTRVSSTKPRPPLPPGPKPLPIIGCMFAMLRNKPANRWFHKMMDDMNTKILCVRLGNTHVITVSDPKIAREFLKEHDAVFSSRPDCMSGYITSDGYSTSSLVPMGEGWKNMRKILATHIVSPVRHRLLQSKRDEESDNLLRYVYNLCHVNGGVVDVRTIVQQYPGNVIRKVLFGTRYFGKGSPDGGPGEEELEQVAAIFTNLAYLYSFCVTDYLPWLRWITDFDGHERIIRKVVKIARKHQDPFIDRRIQEWKDGVRTKEDDLLDVFINLKPKLSVEEIKAECHELNIATVDNPANGVEWALAEMINQPKIFDKALQEIDAVVGKDRLVQESDLPKLNYVKACAREAFRLHPLAPFNVPHVSSVDATVAGYFIPKGSHLLLSRPGLGRNPEIWEDPLTFNPDRHIKGDNEVVLADNNLTMLSFSTGRRGCPGVLLGSTITTMLLARLVQGFTWELPPGEHKVDLNENQRELSKAKPLFALAKPRLSHHLYPMS